MTPIDLILGKLHNVRQTKPGSWQTGCPCCASRRGRPLSVTEGSDGRVLMHAFCGCETASVLGALGLTVTDLFEKPLAPHAAPAAPRIPSGEVLAALSHEATTIALIAAMVHEKREITDGDWARLANAVHRVNNARDYINEKAR